MTTKLHSKLMHIKFDSSHFEGPIRITWYKFIETEDGDTEGVCFNQQEEKQLINYMINNPTNFSTLDSETCDESDGCYMDSIYDSLPSNSLIPDYLVIKKGYNFSYNGNRYSTMNIELQTNNGTSNHNTYQMDFDIIGEVNK